MFLIAPIAMHHHEVQNLFADQKNSDLYWEALLQVGNNHRERALELVGAIRANRQMHLLASWKEKHPDLASFFDRLFLSSVYRSPQLLSYLGLFESIGIRGHNAYLDDLSIQRVRGDLEEAKTNLTLLQNYLPEEISDSEKISYQSALWTLTHLTAAENFIFHSYPITQLFGVVQDLTLVFTLYHKLETKEDVDNYLSRLGQVPKQISQVIEVLKYQQGKNILPPRFAVEKSMQMIAKFIEAPPEKNIFYRHLEETVIPTEDILSKTKVLIEKKVYPAYRKLQQHLETMLSKNNLGVWALPEGDAYYAHCLAFHTTTKLTADEIHELGLKEVEKIESEMRDVLKKGGLDQPEKTVGKIIQEISKNKAFYYPNTLEGKEECLAAFNAILTRCRKELWPLFGIKPEAAVVVKPVPEHEQEGAPGAYYCAPSIDGSRPGAFYVNLSDMNDMAKYQMETLAVHEAEPGHHFQISIENESSLPLLRKVSSGYTAYIEGWALYTEKLAYEQNFYSTIYDQLGHLQYDLLRAARLVLDTGIHRKRWSRERAIDYMEKTTGMSKGDVVAEIERYFVLPGQACAYKIGQLKILELREKAKGRLGESFDIREFHDVVLKTGAVPLSILEEVVDGYIKEKKSL